MVRRPYISPRRSWKRLLPKRPLLTYDGHPHIIEGIAGYSDRATQLAFRRTCAALRRYVDRLSVADGILFEWAEGGTPCSLEGRRLAVLAPVPAAAGRARKTQLDAMRRAPRVVLGGGATVSHLEELLAAMRDDSPMSIVHDGTGPPLNLTVLAPRYLDVDAVVRCQCSRFAPQATFRHAATHLTVHLTLPPPIGGEMRSACSLIRGLWSPTVQLLQLCFEAPDWPFEILIPCLFPEPLVVHPHLEIRFHFAWWVSFDVVAKTRALRRILARHFRIPLKRVQEVISVRPFPTMRKVTCAHTPERPYSR